MSTGIGIIGCGHWGQNYVRVFNELTGSHVAGVCDVVADRLELIRRRYPQTPTYSKIDRMLDDPTIHAVVVALPASRQGNAVRAAIDASKHVLVEKPFALEIDQVVELAQSASRAGITLMVGYTFLYNSAVRKLKRCLDDQTQGIGELYYMHAVRTALGPVRHDVNAAWDLASHDVAIFSYLLDAWPQRVNAVGAQFLKGKHEDVVFVTLTYPNGVVGHIHASWADANRVRQVVIVGSRQRIVFDDLNIHERVKIFEQSIYSSRKDTNSFGEFMLAVRDGDIFSPKIEVSEPLKNECEHFLSSIREGSTPLTSGEFGLKVISVLKATDQSLANDGAPIEVSYERAAH